MILNTDIRLFSPILLLLHGDRPHGGIHASTAMGRANNLLLLYPSHPDITTTYVRLKEFQQIKNSYVLPIFFHAI